MKQTKLTIEEVKHIAKLAKLVLTAEEIEKFQQQLSAVLDYFKLLNQLDTDKVKPTSQVGVLENVLREDKVKTSLKPEQALQNTDKTHNHYFVVPSVFE